MRVAHVITRMIVGGAQENTLLTCLELIEAYDDDVLLITGPSTGPEGTLLNDKHSKKLIVVEIPSLQRAIAPWKDFRSLGMIRKTLRWFAPDVVHTHSAKGGVLGRRAAWSLTVPAIVHTVHGAPFHPFQPALHRWFYRWCERRAASQCHQFVSVANAMTDLMVNGGIGPRQKFQTIYSGMDVEPFLTNATSGQSVRASWGFRPENVVIGKVARLFPLKGHDDLIRSAAEVIKANPHVRFMLVGDGLLREALMRSIKNQGLQDHFVFTGLVDPEQIPGLVGAMDILVHQSYREGLARALPQGLLAGKPVVSYDIDGAREVIVDGETGYLVPPGDTRNVARRLIELSGDTALRVRLGTEGQRRFTDRFRYQNMVAQLRKLYRDLLD